VAIFKAHKAAVIVFADEGDHRFETIADAVIFIPVAPSPLPVILNTMAGHLWGYYAARAIDQEAQIFREFRGRLATELTQRAHKKLSIFEIIDDISFSRIINEFYSLFNDHLLNGSFSLLGGKTIANLPLLLKYTAGKLPLQDIRQELNVKEDMINPFDLLDVALMTAIEELTRPIDAIRHQAKTVTVGTSRKEKELKGIIFELLETLNFSVINLTYREILTINRIQPAVASVRGYTVYDISGLDEKGNPAENSMIVIRAKGGIAANMTSRANNPTTLMGKSDSMPIIVIPLLGDNNIVSYLLLIHINYNEKLQLSDKTNVLGYRYHDIRNLVNEFNIPWRDEYLESFSLEELFSESVETIAGQIKNLYSQQ
jgi:glucosamine--fructose-6-phosphate aminotransferase (isomerizing)